MGDADADANAAVGSAGPTGALDLSKLYTEFGALDSDGPHRPTIYSNE